MAEQQISWMALEKGTRIVSSDDEELGRVAEIVADRQKDIFSGLTFRSGLLGRDRFVPADLIDRMTSDEVRLAVSADAAEEKLEDHEG